MTEDLISKNGYTWGKLKSLLERRSDQNSFHIFSETHMRGQIFNLKEGQHLSPVSSDGNLLITGLRGIGHILVEGDTVVIEELDQILINPKVSFSLFAKTNASFQFVWSPPFAQIEHESRTI
jgi:hypothetical protein